MNSIPFFVLATLPLLAFGQLSPTQYPVMGCNALKYSQTYYSVNADNLLGPGQGYVISSFDQCLQKCLGTPQCKAVNFVDGENCQLFRNGLSDPNTADPNSYFTPGDGTSDHGYISSCPDLTATGPVGCGVQADAYKPTLGKLTRIIGGSVAKPHSWPWQVRLRAAVTATQGFACGASLVRVSGNKEESDILITAAHCITTQATMVTDNPVQYDPSQVTATAGAHDLQQAFELGRQVRKAAQILKHPNYRRSTINDIAIIKLETPIKFSDTIRPICLPDVTEDIPTGKFCAVAGWGRNNSYNEAEASTVLKQLAVQAQSAQTCQDGWGLSYNEDQMVCAGDLEGKEGTCQGDSGGMLACQRDDGGWTLYGATSFGQGADKTCVRAGQPAVFSRVSKYRQWIDDSIGAMTSVV